jgi:hypothetical protein
MRDPGYTVIDNFHSGRAPLFVEFTRHRAPSRLIAFDVHAVGTIIATQLALADQ